MIPSLTAECPAKINLSLIVLGRRDDGYHELDTVFQAVDLWDRLTLEPSDTLTLACDDPQVPVDARNLVIGAAEALAAAAGVPARGSFTLAKAIPCQGGLGGGSSDAAAALVLCSRAWGIEASPDLLQEVAAGLGADVPFFLVGGTAHGTGRGDRIRPLEPLGEVPLVLGFPPFGVPTPAAFAGLAERLTLPVNGVSLAPRFAHKWWTDNDFAAAKNDLETVVFDRWPVLRGFRDALLACGARRAMLSGSGSTVFGAFSEQHEARRQAGELAGRFPDWRILETRTTPRGIRVV